MLKTPVLPDAKQGFLDGLTARLLRRWIRPVGRGGELRQAATGSLLRAFAEILVLPVASVVYCNYSHPPSPTKKQQPFGCCFLASGYEKDRFVFLIDGFVPMACFCVTFCCPSHGNQIDYYVALFRN